MLYACPIADIRSINCIHLPVFTKRFEVAHFDSTMQRQKLRGGNYDCSYLNGNHPLNQLSARSSCTGNNPITTQRKSSWLVCKGGLAYVHTYRPPVRPHHGDTSEISHHFQPPKNLINEITSSRKNYCRSHRRLTRPDPWSLDQISTAAPRHRVPSPQSPSFTTVQSTETSHRPQSALRRPARRGDH